MARREWNRLSDSTRRRYTGYGKQRGWSAKRVQREYESGRPLSHMRGHGRTRAEENKTQRERRRVYAAAERNNYWHHPGSKKPGVQFPRQSRDYYRDDDGDEYGQVRAYLRLNGSERTLARLDEQLAAMEAYLLRGDNGPGRDAWFNDPDRPQYPGLFMYH